MKNLKKFEAFIFDPLEDLTTEIIADIDDHLKNNNINLVNSELILDFISNYIDADDDELEYDLRRRIENHYIEEDIYSNKPPIIKSKDSDHFIIKSKIELENVLNQRQDISDELIKKIAHTFQEIRKITWNDQNIKEFKLKEYLTSIDRLVSYHYAKGSHDDKKYFFIPLPNDYFYDSLKLVKNNNHHFYELGCGVGTKTLFASLLGFKSIGFELNPKLVELSHKFGLSDLVKEADITKVSFESPAVLYYYQPLYSTKDMYHFELQLCNKIKIGDYILRYVTYDPNRYPLPLKSINNKVYMKTTENMETIKSKIMKSFKNF